jgi:hypothetical protein
MKKHSILTAAILLIGVISISTILLPKAHPLKTQGTIPSTTIAPQSKTVNLKIIMPDNTIATKITLNANANVCDILQQAKKEGKLTSLTFDDSYLTTAHSRYIKEINGYKNNWTFKVNNSSPLGCSLITPRQNDSVVWKFE